MQRLWSVDELGECWSLLPEDLALLAGRVDAGKLGFAVQLAFWRQHGRFPDEEVVVDRLAARIGVGADALDSYAWAGRSGRRHRVAIIGHLAVAAFDEAAGACVRHWLAGLIWEQGRMEGRRAGLPLYGRSIDLDGRSIDLALFRSWVLGA